MRRPTLLAGWDRCSRLLNDNGSGSLGQPGDGGDEFNRLDGPGDRHLLRRSGGKVAAGDARLRSG